MTDRHPSAAFWITVTLVAVLVGYPLSFGPACWLVAWTNQDGVPILPKIYVPIARLTCRSEYVHDVLRRFVRIGIPQNTETLCLPAHFDSNAVYVFVVR